MAVENAEKESNTFVVPTAPPPPNLPKKSPSREGKNLMKCAATLIGNEMGKLIKESALDTCRRFLDRYELKIPEERNSISWFYHNNDVKAYLQDGPTCGLVALNLAADILKTSSRQIATNNIQELLKVAQESGFTYHGEMFSAQDMGLLANKYYGLKFNILNDALDDYVKLVEHLCQGYPVLVPYDEDRNHEPCLKRGHKAHWAIITGFLVGLKDDNICLTSTYRDDHGTSIHPFVLDKVQIPSSFETRHLFLIARQGKSRHYAVWPWLDLNNSNKNLFEFDQVNDSHLPNDQEKLKCMFTEGVHAGLCSKVVLLFAF